MSGNVYFLQIGASGPVKIGFTAGAPLERMADLQVANPSRLRLLGSLPGSKLNEVWLHEQFPEFRMMGEWFEPDASIIAGVGCILSPSFAWPVPERNSNLIERAITMAGSEAALARGTRLSQPLINKAKKAGRAGPRLALAIHHFSNGQIPASEIRPDLWRNPEDVPPLVPEPERAA